MKNDHYLIFHYDMDKLAGTERAVYNLIEYLGKHKTAKTTLILANEPCELAFDLSQIPIEVVFLGVTEKERYSNVLVSHFRHLIRLCKYLEKQDQSQRYTAITTNPLLALVMFIATRLRLRVCKALITCEHFSIGVAGKGTLLIRKLLYRYLYVVTLTQNDRQIIDQKFHPIEATCIPNAIPFQLNSYRSFKHNTTFLSIGRLTPQKGFDMLIHSFAKIASKHPNWSLIIVGDDYGEKAMLQNLIGKYKLQQQIIIEPATKNIVRYYQEAAFFVLSSRFEGLPMVLLEAMAFGLPIASFDCPTGPKEVVDDSNGFLVDNGNILQLSNAIETLISNESVRFQKAAGSEQKAQLYTKKQINSLWDKFLLNIEKQ